MAAVNDDTAAASAAVKLATDSDEVKTMLKKLTELAGGTPGEAQLANLAFFLDPSTQPQQQPEANAAAALLNVLTDVTDPVTQSVVVMPEYCASQDGSVVLYDRRVARGSFAAKNMLTRQACVLGRLQPTGPPDLAPIDASSWTDEQKAVASERVARLNGILQRMNELGMGIWDETPIPPPPRRPLHHRFRYCDVADGRIELIGVPGDGVEMVSRNRWTGLHEAWVTGRAVHVIFNTMFGRWLVERTPEQMRRAALSYNWESDSDSD